MKLLDVQCILHEASQPGAQLYCERWRMSAMISQHYVLAAIILCLDLNWDMKFGNSREDEIEMIWPRDTRLQKLKHCYKIWTESSRISTIAAKAAEGLRTMLKRLELGNLKTAQERPVGSACSMLELITVSNPASHPGTLPQNTSLS